MTCRLWRSWHHNLELRSPDKTARLKSAGTWKQREVAPSIIRCLDARKRPSNVVILTSLQALGLSLMLSTADGDLWAHHLAVRRQCRPVDKIRVSLKLLNREIECHCAWLQISFSISVLQKFRLPGRSSWTWRWKFCNPSAASINIQSATTVAKSSIPSS